MPGVTVWKESVWLVLDTFSWFLRVGVISLQSEAIFLISAGLFEIGDVIKLNSNSDDWSSFDFSAVLPERPYCSCDDMAKSLGSKCELW